MGRCALVMILRQKCWWQWNVTVAIVLPLVTLGGVTKNRNDPISVTPPKMAKESTIVTVTCHYCQRYSANLHQWKHVLSNRKREKHLPVQPHTYFLFKHMYLNFTITLVMILRQKCWWQWNVTVAIVLSLVTLGSVTKNRNDPISVTPPKITKKSTIVTVTCHYR